MAVWRTNATRFTDAENDQHANETLEVLISTNLPFNDKTSVEFQKLAWPAVRVAKPDWVPANHVIGVVKTGTLLNGTLVMLSHEYTQVS